MLDIQQQGEAVQSFKKYFDIKDTLPDFQTLQKILVHFSRLPYENLSKIIKFQHLPDDPQKIRMPMEVLEGFFEHQLGGTCFSLTYFLQSILDQTGFVCYPVLADMKWGKNVHCALIVLFHSKKYLVDPGYLFHEPFEIDLQNPRSYHSPFSGVELTYSPEKETFSVYTFQRDQMKWRYNFCDHPVSPATFLNVWLESFNWNSMNGLCLTKVENNKMIYVHKTFMRETGFDSRKNFNIKNNYHETLQQIFGISREIVDEALAANEANLIRKKELGLWTPQ